MSKLYRYAKKVVFKGERPREQCELPPMAAVQSAADYLGLKWPIEIQPFGFWNTGPQVQARVIAIRDDGTPMPEGKHHIEYFSGNWSDIIWHELAHCRQIEQNGGIANFWELYARVNKITVLDHVFGVDLKKYLDNPYEREAFEVAMNAPFEIK